MKTASHDTHTLAHSQHTHTTISRSNTTTATHSNARHINSKSDENTKSGVVTETEFTSVRELITTLQLTSERLSPQFLVCLDTISASFNATKPGSP